jgi:acetamidase/formamidase
VHWGFFSRSLPPRLEVSSGDSVTIEVLTHHANDDAERMIRGDAGAESVFRWDGQGKGVDRRGAGPMDASRFGRGAGEGQGVHVCTGPVAVRGAEPGDVLEVRILRVSLAIPYGYNGCSGFLRELCGEPRTRIIRLDGKRMHADLGGGIVVPLKPFFGSMGVAPPPDSGRVSSNPPGIHAGNLDNKELVAGTTLFIPIHAAGALFEVGDGHAAQGDGEVDQTAIETSLRGRLQLIVRKDLKLVWPRGETRTDIITMGTDTSLTVATRIAVREMVSYLMAARALTQVEAYRLASIAADLHITQLVDQRVGVHMMIPKKVLGLPSR